MKKLLNWLFSDFLYNLYQWAEQKFTLAIDVANTFALFKNGIEIDNTRFTDTAPFYTTNPGQPFTVITQGGYGQIVGNATIDITQAEIDLNTGDIELRSVSANVLLEALPASLSASLNFEKVGDPIVP